MDWIASFFKSKNTNQTNKNYLRRQMNKSRNQNRTNRNQVKIKNGSTINIPKPKNYNYGSFSQNMGR